MNSRSYVAEMVDIKKKSKINSHYPVSRVINYRIISQRQTVYKDKLWVSFQLGIFYLSGLKNTQKLTNSWKVQKDRKDEDQRHI